MNLKLMFLFMALFTLKGFGQSIDNIDLPREGTDVVNTATTQLYKLYVTKNQEVYNNNKRFDYFEDISFSMIDQRNKSEEYSYPQKLLLVVMIFMI